jgi:hypothetical protein
MLPLISQETTDEMERTATHVFSTGFAPSCGQLPMTSGPPGLAEDSMAVSTITLPGISFNSKLSIVRVQIELQTSGQYAVQAHPAEAIPGLANMPKIITSIATHLFVIASFPNV